jgi:predicted Zn-dependent peptidase
MTDIKRIENEGCISVYRYGADKFKSESISVYFSVPNVKEESVKRSLLLAVLKRGTEKYPSQRLINERLDELYATLVNIKNQKFDNEQLIGITADIICPPYTEDGSDLLPETLDMIDQMLFHPLVDKENGCFVEEYVKSEKENYKSIILSQINEPRTYAAIRCREEMFRSLGIVDTLDTMCEKIEEISNGELYNCYKKIINTASIKAFYVGQRDADEVYRHIKNTFGSREIDILKIPRGEIKLLEDCEEPNVVNESSDVSQGRLIMGFNCRTTWRDEGYYAMLLCNEILGASPISKLMMNVREALSLCYECSSIYNSARGALFVTTGIDPENYDLARGAILDQIEQIREGKISDAEFSAAKKSIFNVYSALADSQSAIERFYLGRLINGIDVDIEEFLHRINDLTLSDVINAANTLNLHTVYFLSPNGLREEESDE